MNCTDISYECLSLLLSNIPLLEELEVIKLNGNLKISLHLWVVNTSKHFEWKCSQLTNDWVNAMSTPYTWGLTNLRVSHLFVKDLNRQLQQLTLICISFPNLKTLEFGSCEFRRGVLDLRALSLLSQLESLKLRTYFYWSVDEVVNWIEEDVTQISESFNFTIFSVLKALLK
jgi:hypothetical protein